VLLVGANPLPNYLAAAVLRPRRVVLVFSGETTGPRDRLAAELAGRLGVEEVASRLVEDPTCAAAVRDRLRGLAGSEAARGALHLNYTGGTKVMAVHARAALGDQGDLRDAAMSYLDDRGGRLRFDDGHDENLPAGLVDLDTVMALQGMEPKRERPSTGEGLPTERDLAELAARVLDEPDLAGRLYARFRDKAGNRLSRTKVPPFRPGEKEGLRLSQPEIPGSDWSSDRYEHWVEYLGGRWLDEWVGGLVRGLGVAQDVRVSLKRIKDRREFELDVVALRDNRVYVVSCTTDPTARLCKSKLFEVALRARQLGGDLARSAVACLLPDPGPANPSSVGPAGVEDDGKAAWDAPNPPRVFGLSHLRAWHGQGGPPDLSGLKTWLRS